MPFYTGDATISTISSVGMDSLGNDPNSINTDETMKAMISSPDDLDMDLTDADIEMVGRFEAAWKKFLERNPSLIPRGKRQGNLEVLQRQIMETFKAKQAVELELQKQLDFFLSSREQLEECYEMELSKANNLQKDIHDYLQGQLDNVAISSHIMRRTIPWSNFLDAVEEVASTNPPSSPSTSKSKLPGVKPTARSLVLVDPQGSQDDKRMRAFRLDHAILTTQVKMLEKEVDRMEKSAHSLEFVGKFLTEHNIWGILNKNQEEETKA